MKYLLDTHIILWSLIDDKRLPKEVKEIIKDNNNQIYYSTVSTWEVELKHLKIKSFKLSGEEFAFLCDENYLLNLPIQNKHIYQLKNFINPEHKDPFDKLLLAQCLQENMVLISHDRKFKAYNLKNVMIV